jgi:hypothetical protein
LRMTLEVRLIPLPRSDLRLLTSDFRIASLNFEDRFRFPVTTEASEQKISREIVAK